MQPRHVMLVGRIILYTATITLSAGDQPVKVQRDFNTCYSTQTGLGEVELIHMHDTCLLEFQAQRDARMP